MSRRTDLKAAFLRVRHVLRRDWNPVGAEGLPEDEYNSYVWPIVGLLREGAGGDAIGDCLQQMELKMQLK